MIRIRNCFKHLFAEKQFFFRTSKQVRFLHLSANMQISLALVALALVGWMILGSYSLLNEGDSEVGRENLRLREQLRNTITTYENRIARLQDESSAQIEDLNERHTFQIGELKDRHGRQTKELNDGYSLQIEELKDGHSRQTTELHNSYSRQIEGLKSSHNSQTRKLNDRHGRRIKELIESHSRYTAELDDRYGLRIKELKSSHSSQTRRLNDGHSQRIEGLKDGHSRQIKELNERFSYQFEKTNRNYNRRIEELNSSYRNQLEELNASYQDLNKRFEKMRNRFFDTVDALETRQHRLRTSLDRFQVLEPQFDEELAEQNSRLVELLPKNSNRLLASARKLSRPLLQSRITPFSFEFRDDEFFLHLAGFRGALQQHYSKAMSNMQENLISMDHWVQEIGGATDSALGRQSIEQSYLISSLEEWIEEDISRIEDILSLTGLPDPFSFETDKTAWQDKGDEHGAGGPLLVESDDIRSDSAAGIGYPPGSERQFARIARKLERLGELMQVIHDLPLFLPLDEEEFRVSSGYGMRIDPFSGQNAFHAGVDFATRYQATALATAPGVVSLAGWSGPYGRIVDIDHGNGIVTRYGHLAKFLVEIGDEVAARQPIGLIGSSGRSTGSHLHYEIRVNGRALDPRQFLKAGHYVLSQR